MGPRSENRGYVPTVSWSDRPSPASFNGSTVREPWLWSELRFARSLKEWLQWVHGPRTVVMPIGLQPGDYWKTLLQWVHGPRTVVMRGGLSGGAASRRKASMGPRSENRGYALRLQA